MSSKIDPKCHANVLGTALFTYVWSGWLQGLQHQNVTHNLWRHRKSTTRLGGLAV